MSQEGERKGTENRNGVRTVTYRPDSDAVSVCNPDWPGTHYAAQAEGKQGQKVPQTLGNTPASSSLVARL